MKWAIIGNGNVVETKSGGAFTRLGLEVWGHVAGRDVDIDFVDRMVATNDAVYIATPPDSHLHYARIAAKHKKPCLVEKPMARTKDEAAIMASIFQEVGVPLWVAYYRRCLPRFLKIKELIDTGAIGQVRFCHIQHTLRPECHPVAPIIEGQPLPWRYKPEINGGGNFVDMGTHHLDLCDYFFGPIHSISGRAKNVGGLYEVEDTVTATFIAGDVPVTGQWCYVAGENNDNMEIVGSGGSISFSLFSDTGLMVNHHNGGGFFDLRNPQWVHQPLVQSIVDEMNGNGKCPSNWENGLRAMKVQDAILNGG